MGASCDSLSSGQLSVQGVFRKSSIVHPTHVAQPAEAAVARAGSPGSQTWARERTSVSVGGLGPSGGTGDSEDAPPAAHAKCAQSVLLGGVQCPGLTGVYLAHAGVVHCHLCVLCQLFVLPDSLCNCKPGECSGGLSQSFC